MQKHEKLADLLWEKVFSKEKSIIWVGSGLSKGFYLEWDEIIKKLCLECGVSQKDNNKENYFEIAENCRNNNSKKYVSTLYQEYGKKKYTNREAHYQIFNINASSIITTNFDPLLEDSAKLTCNCTVHSFPVLDVTDVNTRPKSLFYIHGSARKNKGHDLIFTTSDFEKEYHAEKGRLRIFINPILLNYSILFIGYSLSEPMLKETMKNIKDVIESNNGEMTENPKYLLQKSFLDKERIYRTNKDKIEEKNRMNKMTEEFQKDYGIEILWYDADSEIQYYEVEKILDILVNYSSKIDKDRTFSGQGLPNV